MSRRVVLGIIVLVLIAAAIPVTMYLVKQRQELREKASVPGGQASVSVAPTTGSYSVGQTFPVSVSFNTAGIAISGIAIRLTYTYSENTPPITASDLQISPDLLGTGDWFCPIKTITPQAGIVKIDLACLNVNVAGYSNTENTPLATFNLQASAVPQTNPVVLSFDAQESKITRKDNGEDTLMIPQSTGTYTITQVGVTPTPTPTGGPTRTPTPTQPAATATPTPTNPPPGGPTSTPTPTRGIGGPPTSTPTPTPTTYTGGSTSPTPTPTRSTVTPTTQPTLPETATLTPTIILSLAGLGFIVLAALLFVL